MGSNFSTLPLMSNYTLQFNNTLIHVVPAELAYLSNALVNRFTQGQVSIQASNKPFPHVLGAIELAVQNLSII